MPPILREGKTASEQEENGAKNVGPSIMKAAVEAKMGAQRDNRQVYESIEYSIQRLAPRSWADRSGVNWRGLPTAMQNARQAPRPFYREGSHQRLRMCWISSPKHLSLWASAGMRAHRLASRLGVSCQPSFVSPRLSDYAPRWPTTSPRNHFSQPAKQS